MEEPPTRIVVAPDSFKGTLTAGEAARAMAAGCRDAGWRGRIALRPLADGGEGTLSVLEGVLDGEVGDGGDWLFCRIDGRGTAVVESARLLGYGLPAMRSRPVDRRGSAALGRRLAALVDHGFRSIVVALGGTAVNDAGLGLLLALGLEVRRGRRPTPDLAGLVGLADRLARAEATLVVEAAQRRFAGVDLTVLCDVEAPLSGPDGATRVFGRQKGIDLARMAALDAAVVRFAEALEAASGRRCSDLAGAGAAGGLGFALALLGGRLVSGADWVIDRVGLASMLSGAACVLTGEGRSDRQTMAGKLPWRVAALARETGVPAVLVSGRIEPAVRARLGRCFERLVEAPAEPGGEAAVALRRAVAGLVVPGMGSVVHLC